MSNLWLKFKVWAKVAVFGLVLIYVIIFVAQNSARPVTPWLFYRIEPQTTVLLLVLYAFLAGILVAILVRTTWRTLNQIRELQERQRAERMERDVKDMKAKADMLRARPDATAGGTSGAAATGDSATK